jgi:hypothetical protein
MARRQVVQTLVGSLGVVVLAPSRDEDRGLGEAIEDLAVQKLIAKLRVEALAIAVLPRGRGSMNAVLTPTSGIHSRTALPPNSGPLAERR